MKVANPEDEIRIANTGLTVAATPEGNLDFSFYYQGRPVQRASGISPTALEEAIGEAAARRDAKAEPAPAEDSDTGPDKPKKGRRSKQE